MKESERYNVGRDLLETARNWYPTNPESSDKLATNVFQRYRKWPHAFVLCCIADRQVSANFVWESLIQEIEERLGSLDFGRLRDMSDHAWIDLFERLKRKHRLGRKMAACFHSAVMRISDVFEGDASQIWLAPDGDPKSPPSAAAIVARFLAFDGVGPKIATMATNILVRDCAVQTRDGLRSVDISADVHIRRVFHRLGLVDYEGARADNEIRYLARALNPDYPGVFDFFLWQLGRNKCRASSPVCGSCELVSFCQFAKAQSK